MTTLRGVAVLFLLLLSAPAYAGVMTVSWSPPTENTDGTPLIDLAGYKLYYGTASGDYTTTIDIGSPGVSTWLIADLAAATYYVVATAYNIAGIESDYSNEAQKVVPPSVPSPPSGLTVTSELVAYGLQQSPDVVTTFPVGSVDSGTACDPTMSVNGKYRVPLSAVTYAGSVRPVVVFAECSGG